MPYRPAVQLPSYLCDNMLKVQPEPRIHRSAAWPQRPNVADGLCALAQLKLRLGELETLQIGIESVSGKKHQL
jgi:hypothetical protein